MYLTNITYDNDNISFTNRTTIENDHNIKFSKYLILSKPSSILLFSLISVMIYTLIKPLIKETGICTYKYI